MTAFARTPVLPEAILVGALSARDLLCPLHVDTRRSIAWEECCAPGRTDAFEDSFRNGRSWRIPSYVGFASDSGPSLATHVDRDDSGRPWQRRYDSVDRDKRTIWSSAPEPRHRARSTVGFDRYSLGSYVRALDRRSERPWLLLNDPSSVSTDRRFSKE
jgi:hypothetical protein